jgi:hypothetical protein
VGHNLAVKERVLLFCVATRTEWIKAGVTHLTARQMVVKNLVERDPANSLSLTAQGRAVLSALLARSGIKMA